MVNENKGKVYEPIPVYNRKMYRQLCRTAVIMRQGYRNVNRSAGLLFRQSMARKKAVKEQLEENGIAVAE